MIALLIEPSVSAFAWLVGWTAALWAGARLADRALHRTVDPAVRTLLYLPVLIRAILPAHWGTPVGPWPAPATGPALGTALDAPLAAALDAPPLSPSLAIEPGPAGLLASLTAPGAPWALIAWGAGVAAIAAVVVARRRRLDRRLHLGSVATDPRLQLRETPVLIHPTLGPLCYGVWHAIVVLPQRLADQPDAVETRCALAHERAHLDRRDPAIAAALTAVTALCWPIVPVWLAARRMFLLIEQATDAQALARLAEITPTAYGQALLAVGHTPPVTATGGFPMAAYTDLRERLHTLIHPARARRALSVPGSVAIAAALLLATSQAPLEAATPNVRGPDITAAADAAFEVTKGHSLVLETPFPIKEIATADPATIHLSTLGSNELIQVLGLAQGGDQHRRARRAGAEVRLVRRGRRARPGGGGGRRGGLQGADRPLLGARSGRTAEGDRRVRSRDPRGALRGPQRPAAQRPEDRLDRRHRAVRRPPPPALPGARHPLIGRRSEISLTRSPPWPIIGHRTPSGENR